MTSLSLYKDTARVFRKTIIYDYFKENSWEDSTKEVNIFTVIFIKNRNNRNVKNICMFPRLQ